ATGTSTPTAATPTFSVAAGTYASAQTVSISDATSGATIYYTTNGTTPTTASTKYSGPIAVSATETLKAIAVASGYNNSTVASAAYTIDTVVPAPTFSPTGGTYTSSQKVTISDTTAGTAIYYTTNGTTPTTASTKYAGPITVSSTETLKAIAVATGDANAVGTATYTITSLPPATTTTVINYPNGFGSSCDSANLWLENNASCASPSVHVVPHVVHNASNM
ncbi:chitobiase/beta-hexosaminidase C-terminal domain-containing protein, partial [Acidicapsa acidisoli]|uniref:chitobiase/beta-hexosaminidase C-terminal domain-containing protein n=1 Tax=Acidicapsa acidisoli TaxID=1615681 RepID=UPI0021DF4C38